jgi:hypothetical protein
VDVTADENEDDTVRSAVAKIIGNWRALEE